MKIDVDSFKRAVILSVEIPFFVGTTGKDGGGAFPAPSTPLNNFLFIPYKGDYGTLVFDHADLAQRSALSPTFFQFWWDKEKLIVREGLGSSHVFRIIPSFHPESGLRRMEKYPTRMYGVRRPHGLRKYRQVGIIDLLRYCEGKIDRAQLDACVIPRE